jgi:hypothetical protein
MSLIGELIDGILWFFAFKSAKGSFLSMVGYRILYGILFVVAIASLLGLIWMLFGHVSRPKHN